MSFEQRLPFLIALFALRSLELRHTLYRRTIFGQAVRNLLPATHPAQRDRFSLRRRLSMICGTASPLTHAGPVPRGPIGSIRAGSGLCNAAQRRTRTRAGEPPPPKEEGRREGERAGPSVPGASAAPPPHRVVMLVGPALQNQQGHHAPQEPGQRHPVSSPPPPRKGAAASAVPATSSKSTPEQTPLTATDSTQKSQNAKVGAGLQSAPRFQAEGPFCGRSEVEAKASLLFPKGRRVNSSIFVVPDPGARFSVRKPSKQKGEEIPQRWY